MLTFVIENYEAFAATALLLAIAARATQIAYYARRLWERIRAACKKSD